MWAVHLPQTSISSSRLTLHLQVNSGTPHIGRSGLDVFSSEFLVSAGKGDSCGAHETIVAILCLSALLDRSYALVDMNFQNDHCYLWKQERRRNLRRQWASFKEGRNFLVIMLSDPAATAKADPRKTLVTGKAELH